VSGREGTLRDVPRLYAAQSSFTASVPMRDAVAASLAGTRSARARTSARVPARPRLSVIVPTLDEAHALPGLLDALLAADDADARPDEVVVVDGGSADDTLARAAAAGCRVLHAPRGRGVQLALGAAAARGDLLAFLHADARPLGGALARVRAAFEDDAVAACAFRQAIQAEGRFYRRVEAAAARRVRRGWVYGDSGLVLRRRLYDALGGFRPQAVLEDLELSRRLRARARVHLVEDAVLAVSPRRWRREGPLRATLRNLALTALWRAGVSADALARWYRPEPGPARPRAR